LADPEIGAISSVTYYANNPAMIEAWGGARVNLWIGYGRNSTVPRSDNWFHSLNGTSLLISSRAIEDVGLLDEGFFLYWEDTEFCLRLRKKGWCIAAAENSKVLHKVNASTGGNKLTLDRYQTASGLRLLRLYAPSHHISAFLFLGIRFLRRMMHLEFARCRSVWHGIQDYRSMSPISQKIR
jgi:hypothetical protein